MEKDFKDRALSMLEEVIDPELGIDIVNLGLIYDVKLETTGLCIVTMTLTIMGCPLTDYLNESINFQLMEMEEVKRVKINLVWNPVWTKDMMSREAKLALNLS
ncbi:metal-sulfur cluster assembly factor [Companilactobacillus sp. HBUAS59544]|uniref:metal-sulfur cluster assembly factor n=1 Tax=Companilactobacillus sp. HBUAS59544 TaxID=3109363 RepID=UPI002FF42375